MAVPNETLEGEELTSSTIGSERLAEAMEISRINRQFGLNLKPKMKPLERQLGVEGVGSGSQTCRNSVELPITMANEETGTYDAPVVLGSSIPGLLGLKALMRHKALLDWHL